MYVWSTSFLQTARLSICHKNLSVKALIASYFRETVATILFDEMDKVTSFLFSPFSSGVYVSVSDSRLGDFRFSSSGVQQTHANAWQHDLRQPLQCQKAHKFTSLCKCMRLPLSYHCFCLGVFAETVSYASLWPYVPLSSAWLCCHVTVSSTGYCAT